MKKLGHTIMYEIQCPICGTSYYVPRSDYDDMAEEQEEYECDNCQYVSELEDWPAQEYSDVTIRLIGNSLSIEEE